MVLPASPEEGKLLKKKYVVFNFDGTIAELKGFELKRRGELEIVKAFQSQVFNQFLCGSSLVECYNAVGSIANRWLDVLDSCGCAMDDEELLQLISEKKTISKTLEDYGDRKATSLTSATRLADFLGAEMVKDRGLNCNLIISKYPLDAPVAERAIPVAIFSADISVRRFYLRKWLKDPSFECNDFRDVVDWEYYKTRLSGTIQKIVTIPAGMQNISNPCPRVEHPAWLVRNLNDSTGLKQLKLTNLFAKANAKPKTASSNSLSEDQVKAPKLVAAPSPSKTTSKAGYAEDEDLLGTGTSIILSPAGKTKKSPAQSTPDSKRKRNLFGTPEVGSERKEHGSAVRSALMDIEDIGGSATKVGRPIVHFRAKPDYVSNAALDFEAEAPAVSPAKADLPAKPMKEVSPTSTAVLCSQIETRDEFNSWLEARKAAWKEKRQARRMHARAMARTSHSGKSKSAGGAQLYENQDHEEVGAKKKPVSVADFVRNAAISAAHGVWQIVEFQETDSPGEFIVWAMTNRSQMQRFRVAVPRVLYLNCLGPNGENAAKSLQGTKIKRDLPHGKSTGSLYEVRVSERKYVRNEKGLSTFLCDPQIEGVYESQTPLWFRAIMKTGCVARLAKLPDSKSTQYKLHDLEFISTQAHPYLEPIVAVYRHIFVYCAVDRARNNGFAGVGLFIVDGTNANFSYNDLQYPELLSGKAFFWIANGGFGFDQRPPMQKIYRQRQPDTRGAVKFATTLVSNVTEGYRLCNEALLTYLREKHGPTVVIAQGHNDSKHWRRIIPALAEFPMTCIPPNTQDELFPAIQWQEFLAHRMIQRFLIFPRWLKDRVLCARHSHIPLCNLGADSLTTMIDVTFGRQLLHNRHLLWSSEGLHPDLGGAETDEHFLWSDPLKEPVLNNPGAYRSVCVDLDVS
jgi:DNA polymerase epsilon subunit 1